MKRENGSVRLGVNTGGSEVVLWDWWLADVRELLVERCLSLGVGGRRNEAEVEERFESVEVPLGFAWLDVHDGASACTFHRVCGYVADVSYGVKALGDVARKLSWRNDFLTFSRNAHLPPEQRQRRF